MFCKDNKHEFKRIVHRARKLTCNRSKDASICCLSASPARNKTHSEIKNLRKRPQEICKHDLYPKKKYVNIIMFNAIFAAKLEGKF